MASKKDEKISCALYVEGGKVTAQAVVDGVVFEGELKKFKGATVYARKLASQFTPEYISQRVEDPVRSMVELASRFTPEEKKAMSLAMCANEVVIRTIKKMPKDEFAALSQKVKKMGGEYISVGTENYFVISIKRD
jgi:hypothetical protein